MEGACSLTTAAAERPALVRLALFALPLPAHSAACETGSMMTSARVEEVRVQPERLASSLSLSHTW